MSRFGYLDLGLAVLQVDSLGARGHGDICATLHAVPVWQRARDAHAAKDWLRAQDWADAERVFLAGFSHGATAVLLALDDEFAAGVPFAGAVAIGPWCPEASANTRTDLLILIGEADRLTPAARCRGMRLADDARLELIVYPGVHHSFDVPGLDGLHLNHPVRYDAEAARDARRRARAFLWRRL